MPDKAEKEWVLPAAIPFETLKARDLEECAYWLLDAMGAQDLEWRVGGSGGGAADQGRDLEAHFYVPSADGEMEAQKWWIECKGRSNTLEADAVKTAANNALAIENLDYLVVATNTTFSNPTRDWVKEWQKKHPCPKVRLWDQSSLERLLSPHPAVVLRLFSQALSLEGRLQAVESRFWNKLEYSSPNTLAEIWTQRETLEFSSLSILALVINEFAHGDIGRRPWAASIDKESHLQILASALSNLPYLALRSDMAGEAQTPVIRAIAYLILGSLGRIPTKDLSEFIVRFVNRDLEEPFPDVVQEFLLLPLLDQLTSELQDVCSNDCERMISLDRATLSEGKDEIETYWDRLDPSERPVTEDKRTRLRIEKTTASCKVGFEVGEKHGCPLFAMEVSLASVEDLIAVLERVVAFRSKQAADLKAELSATGK